MHALRQLLGFRVRDYGSGASGLNSSTRFRTPLGILLLKGSFVLDSYTIAEGKLCVGQFMVPLASLVMTVSMLQVKSVLRLNPF